MDSKSDRQMNVGLERNTALKALRSARKTSIALATETVKRQRREIQAILGVLEKSSATVPEVSAATGIPSALVLWYVAALKKYGKVAEAEKEEGYFRYRSIALAKESVAEGETT
uniref:Winged helix-turn-helix domain-containing protein n=1 Tax=Desulfatirhabdium butyrativorans TaxID=340467 RepID=A0A7C4W124_9BACT